MHTNRRHFGRRLAHLLGGVAALAACAGWTGAAATPLPAPSGIVAGELQVLEDSAANATLEQILGRVEDFRPVLSPTPNYGFSPAAYWFRLPVENRRSATAELFLVTDHAVLDHVTMYLVTGGTVRATVHTGDRMPARERPYLATALVLPFELPAHTSAQIYVRVHGDAMAVMVPLRLTDAAQLHEALLDKGRLQGIVIGLLAALFLYNLMIAVLLVERAYRYYVLYLLFAFLAITAMNGFGPAVMYPGATWPGNEGLIVFTALSNVAIMLFTRTFLRTAEHRPLDRFITLLIGFSLFHAAAVFLLPVRAAYALNLAMVSIGPLVTTGIGIFAWRLGRREARFYVFAQVTAFAGMVVFGAVISGALPYHHLVFDTMPVALGAAALLHALALADRIRLLQRAKLEAENIARRNLQVRKDELEQLVNERTAELERARANAERLAVTDPLTGIANRRGVIDPAEREVKRALRNGRPLAAIMFDLDHFKRVNDTYGHAEGDRVLRDVAAAARKEIRDTDLLGRVGGEEFLVVLPETDRNAAVRVAERIRARMAYEISVGSPPQPVTASFGVAWLSEHTRSIDALESAADAALYRAKRNGRNRVETVEAPL